MKWKMKFKFNWMLYQGKDIAEKGYINSKLIFVENDTIALELINEYNIYYL
jgi:hypothetical protein